MKIINAVAFLALVAGCGRSVESIDINELARAFNIIVKRIPVPDKMQSNPSTTFILAKVDSKGSTEVLCRHEVNAAAEIVFGVHYTTPFRTVDL